MLAMFGLIDNGIKENALEKLQEMKRPLLSLGSFKFGEFENQEFGVYVGWVNNGSTFCDCLPISNEDGTITLIYIGEDYRDITELDWLKSKNHRFNKRNASYIVHMYEEFGDDFLGKLNGWFHGILIDAKARRVIIFNDRYGMRRLYYSEAREAFYFSSEAKCILSIVPEARGIDLRSLAQLFVYGCVISNRSIFNKVGVLPAATMMEFGKEGKRSERRYFDFSLMENQVFLGREFHYEKLKFTLEKSLRRYFRKGERIGICLARSIGTIILLASANFFPKNFSFFCYACESPPHQYIDVSAAKKLAKCLRHPLHILSLNSTFFSKLPAWAEQMTITSEGTLDLSAILDFYLSRKTEHVAPIKVLSGGAELLFGKKDRLRRRKVNLSLFNEEFREILLQTSFKSSENRVEHELTSVLTQVAPWTIFGKINSLKYFGTVRDPFFDNDVVRLMYQVPNRANYSDAIIPKLIKDESTMLWKVLREEGIACKRLWRDFIRCVQNHGRRKSILKHFPYTCNKLVPKALPKRYEKKLLSYTTEILLDTASLSRPYLAKSSLERILLSKYNIKKKYFREIQVLASIELVHRLLLR